MQGVWTSWREVNAANILVITVHGPGLHILDPLDRHLLYIPVAKCSTKSSLVSKVSVSPVFW